MAEKVFTNGLVYKVPRERAPDYVKGSLSFKTEDFIAWLREHDTESGWVNVQIKESKGGKMYCELDTWKPNSTEKEDREYDRKADAQQEPEGAGGIDYPAEDINPDDIPF